MIIYGKNPVLEFINNSPDIVEKVYILGGGTNRENALIIEAVNRIDIPLLKRSKQQLNDICKTSKHQGVVAKIKDFEYADLKYLLKTKKDKNKIIVILDHLEDPQNFGAILRSCSFFAVDGVVIPRNRAVSVTPAVIKVSAGGASSVPVTKVTNLSATIKKLKDSGYWIVGTDAGSGDDLRSLNVNGLDIAVIVGNESNGISEKLKAHCDYLVGIVGYGEVSSLNVSVATGIIIYELSEAKSGINLN